jgi:AcrR family transcriptional regulator
VTSDPVSTLPRLPGATPGGDHRERLLAAMAQAVIEHGFRETTVADVVRIARTSRRTFYEHFEDREACFIALLDVFADAVIAQLTAAIDPEAPWEEQVERGVAAHLEFTGAEPELMRSYIREVTAVGPRGVVHQRQAVERFAQVLVDLSTAAHARGASIRPLGRDTAFLICAGLRELAVATVEEGRDLRELQRPLADTIKAVLRDA